jgi:peptidoglycan hydrolase CwlO-like protein
MHKGLILVCLIFSFSAQALEFGYLKPTDQKYYKNEAMAGMNQQERIDSTVKEINKLHGDIDQLKKDMAMMRAEIEALKNAPPKK